MIKACLLAILMACTSDPDPHVLEACTPGGSDIRCEVGCLEGKYVNQACTPVGDSNGSSSNCLTTDYMGVIGCCDTVGSGSERYERFFSCQP